MKLPIFIDGEVTVHEVARIFEAAGYVVRVDGAGRFVATRIPPALRAVATENVREIAPARAKRKTGT